ncbi:hypothetical protein TNCV_1422441 [Trichonephila clavipes]|nr:hypothetical protein TNCV_1422441 [Trichonephila clavipes]
MTIEPKTLRTKATIIKGESLIRKKKSADSKIHRIETRNSFRHCKATVHISKSTSTYLTRKEPETEIKCIPFNETPLKSFATSPTDFCAFGLLNDRATSLLVRLVEGEERWEASYHPQGVLPHNWGGMLPNPTITCFVLKAKTNDKRKTSPLPSMNFVGLDLMLQSVTIDQLA